MAKVGKRSVRYRGTWSRSRRCGTCTMFRPGKTRLARLLGTGNCTLVEGIISDDAVCDKWEAKP